MEEDKEKTIYLIQIQHLDRLLESLQLRCDGLQLQNRDLVSGCGALATDQMDICEYLKLSLQPDQRTQELQETRLQDAEREHQTLRRQHGQDLQDLQDRVQQQEAETTTRAASLEEQRQQLEEQEQRLLLLTEQQSGMESEEEQLLRQQEALESSLRLREETLSTEACGFQTKTLDLVREERARHGRRREDFQNLLAQNEVLWKQKAALKVQKMELLQEGDGLRDDLETLRHKNCTCSTELENLRRRSQKLKVELKECSSAHEPVLEEEETLRRLLTSASEERRQKASEANRLRAELQRERSGSGRLEAGMLEAVTVLAHILTDSEKTFRTRGERLLEILQSSGPQGPGSTPEESSGRQGPGSTPEESSGPQGPGSTPEESSDPRMDRTQTLSLATDPLFLMARYRPGDLGFIPRPTWTHKAAASRQKLCRQKRSGSDPEAFTAAHC